MPDPPPAASERSIPREGDPPCKGLAASISGVEPPPSAFVHPPSVH